MAAPERLPALQSHSDYVMMTNRYFLECSFNVDEVAVIFRGGEDENLQNNRNAASCVLLTACTALYDSAEL